jgi:hypothetical protein
MYDGPDWAAYYEILRLKLGFGDFVSNQEFYGYTARKFKYFKNWQYFIRIMYIIKNFPRNTVTVIVFFSDSAAWSLQRSKQEKVYAYVPF